MEEIKLAKIANCKKERVWRLERQRLGRALDTINELFGIEFGSITIRFHGGKWSPKVQIEKRLLEDLENE